MSPVRRASCRWTTPRASSCCATRSSAPTSSTSTSAFPRCRSTPASAASPTPTTRRSTCAWTRQELDAREIVNGWDERQLGQLFRRYGEEPNARRIAREIVGRREKAPITTTGELVAAIEAALPAAVRRRFGGGHPAKRVFQAVRIAVNAELDSLDRALPSPGSCCARTAASRRSPSTRSRTGA